VAFLKRRRRFSPSPASELLPYPHRTERESIAADPRHVIGMSPEERAGVFVGLDRTMEAILANRPSANSTN
jgi:hypothetical protein